MTSKLNTQSSSLVGFPQFIPSQHVLAAGRTAFKKHRDNLSDLYDFFDCDLDEFLIEIFTAMTEANVRTAS